MSVRGLLVGITIASVFFATLGYLLRLDVAVWNLVGLMALILFPVLAGVVIVCLFLLNDADNPRRRKRKRALGTRTKPTKNNR